MMFVDYILSWAREKGYAAVYGSPEQVNEMLTNVPFASSQDGTAVIMHLVADSETYNGHDRAVVAVYFASLCPFDFNGESLLPEQERLKNVGKALLNDIRAGNALAYADTRWQYGYDDYAENVAWVCLRVTITALAADCVPLPMPEPPAYDMIPLPDVAAEVIKQLSGGQYEGTIRDNVLAEVLANGKITVVFVGVSQSPPPSSGVDVYVTLNGERNHVETVTPGIVTEEIVELYPQLAPYIGYYGYTTIYIKASEETEFCAVIEFEGVYTSPEVCWEEEVPELDVLNFYMPFGGTITLRRVGSPTVVELEYSTDGGRTWHIWEEVGNDRMLTLPQEGRMWIRNTSETSTGFSLSSGNYYRFLFGFLTFGYGNTDSLLCKNPNNAVLTNYCYWRLFYGTDVGLLFKSPDLMAKNAANYCYSQMYYNNKNIAIPPVMLLENAAGDCCRSMFEACNIQQLPVIHIKTLAASSLAYFAFNTGTFTKVVTYMTDISAQGSLYAWMRGVASSGDFYCDPNLTIPTGAFGIPSGWTRHDLSELE